MCANDLLKNPNHLTVKYLMQKEFVTVRLTYWKAGLHLHVKVKDAGRKEFEYQTHSIDKTVNLLFFSKYLLHYDSTKILFSLSECFHSLQNSFLVVRLASVKSITGTGLIITQFPNLGSLPCPSV